MNILFLAGLIPEEMEEFVIKNTTKSVEFAANKYQKLMLRGLKSASTKLTVINSMFVNSFPRGFKKPYIESFSNIVNAHNENYSFINTAFLNVFGIRHFSKCSHVKKEVYKWLKDNLDTQDNYVLGYSVFGESIDIFKKIKKTNPDVKTCLIIPDLPNYCYGKNKLYNSFLYCIDKKLRQNKNVIDKYILFSKHMAEELNISEDKYTVIEGICDEMQTKENIEYTDNNRIIILYSGAVEEKYGLISLLEAFKQIHNENVELHICGSGSAEEYYKKEAINNNRIILHGKLPNEQVTKMQKKADILINPRLNEKGYTRFSFPSKTMEYLVSGTPMIGYKLEGIPDEYDEYITYVEGNKIEDLANTIEKMASCGKEHRDALGCKARAFIIKNRNSKIQAQRVVEFLKKG